VKMRVCFEEMNEGVLVFGEGFLVMEWNLE
jgi:hypothetical protein